MSKMQKVEITGNYPYSPDGKKTVVLRLGMVVEVPERIAKDIKAKNLGKGTQKNTDMQVQQMLDLDAAESEAAKADEAVDDRIAELKQSFEDVEVAHKEEIEGYVERIDALESANKEAVAVIKKAGLLDQLKGEDKTTWERFMALVAGKS